MENLPRRQQEVVEFIGQYKSEHGYCPSLADVARGLGLHCNTVVAHVLALKEKGYIRNEYRVTRSLMLVDQVNCCW
jgi:repressor LexA